MILYGPQGQVQKRSDGGMLSLRLPRRAGQDDLARLRVEVGAVLAFRHTTTSQQAAYRLTAACLAVQP